MNPFETFIRTLDPAPAPVAGTPPATTVIYRDQIPRSIEARGVLTLFLPVAPFQLARVDITASTMHGARRVDAADLPARVDAVHGELCRLEIANRLDTPIWIAALAIYGTRPDAPGPPLVDRAAQIRAAYQDGQIDRPTFIARIAPYVTGRWFRIVRRPPGDDAGSAVES